MYQNEALMLALRRHTFQAFLKGDTYQESIREQNLGLLHLTSGRIVANDTLCLYEQIPVAQNVAPGSYPVILYIYHCDDDQRAAFAEIRFSEAVPALFAPVSRTSRR